MRAQIQSSPEQLAIKARRITGIDLTDTEALEPLGVLLRSLNEDSLLHQPGADALEARILRILCNRLRMQRDYARHPEIADQQIQAPIFLCGMGRTGSTKSQKLLAMSGDFNWLTFWQALNPSLISGSPSESPQARIDDTEQFAQWFDRASPEVKFAHAFETHEPEEESPLLEHSFKSPVWLGWSPIDQYLGWLMQRDMSTQFVYLRDALKYLQWQGFANPRRRWMLKCPLYTGLEAPLLEVFPDACLVMTHRHPRVTMPSGLRLLELFYKPYTNSRPDPETYIAGQAALIQAHLHNRASIGGLKFLDVNFNEVLDSPRPLIEKIYRFCGVPLTAASRQRMLDWNDANPPHKKGRHVYELADYGVTPQTIDTMFAAYIDFLKSKFGA